MRPTNGKAVNRYYQIDGLTPRGSVIATIFVKADNIAQVRNYLAQANEICKWWVKDCYAHGIFTGNITDNITTRFNVSPVCWRYAYACANGGLDITDGRPRLEMRHTVRALADYLFHNLAPYQARHRAAIA